MARTSNFTISRRRLADCVKILHQKRAAGAARLFFRSQPIKLLICCVVVQCCCLLRQRRQEKPPQLCMYRICKVFVFCTPCSFLACFLHFYTCAFHFVRVPLICTCYFVAAPRLNVWRTEVDHYYLYNYCCTFFSASSVTGCFTNNGEDFHANVSVTEKGYVCQAWNSTKPHYHILSPEDHPEIGGGHNFCRNPGGQKRQPWCFTTDESAKFDYCDIPRCGERIS